jgi:hypothetical protein
LPVSFLSSFFLKTVLLFSAVPRPELELDRDGSRALLRAPAVPRQAQPQQQRHQLPGRQGIRRLDLRVRDRFNKVLRQTLMPLLRVFVPM